MSPQLRGKAATATMLDAAHELLGTDDPGMPSVEAIARSAGVTRATVYNHFTSRAGLVDAVLVEAVRRHGMDRLVERSQGLAWREALMASVRTCAGFWRAEHMMLRRLYAAEVIEPDVTDRLRQREGWRAKQFSTILKPRTDADVASELVGVVVALTSFPTYDQLVVQTGSHPTSERAMLVAVGAAVDSDEATEPS